jgi:hypothetical protein
MKTFPFIMYIKIIGINLTMEVKGLYDENYKKLIKEIDEHTHRMNISFIFSD